MNEIYLKRLAKLSELHYGLDVEKPSQSATAVIEGLELFVPLAGLIDLNKELERLKAKIKDMEGRLNAVSKKLENKNFVERAPKKVIDHEKQKKQKYEDDVSKLLNNLKTLQ